MNNWVKRVLIMYGLVATAKFLFLIIFTGGLAKLLGVG